MTKLANLHDARDYLLQNFADRAVEKENWSPFKTFVHCAQTIDFAKTGYPEYKPVIIQDTVGRLVIGKFLRQGYMRHDLTAPVPGAPEIASSGAAEAGLSMLVESIDHFLTWEGDLKRHLIFGRLDKADYDRYFTMHIVDHLSEFKLR